MATIPASQRKKQPSSFQVTGVSLTQRTDVGDDSADDLDESHTDDISRITDNETPSFSEDTCSRDAEDGVTAAGLSAVSATTAIPTSLAIVPVSPPTGEVVSDKCNKALSNMQNSPDIPPSPVKRCIVIKHCAENIPINPVTCSGVTIPGTRFKVVKIESMTPFRRGRWTCMDYLDNSENKPKDAYTFDPNPSTTDGYIIQFPEPTYTMSPTNRNGKRSNTKTVNSAPKQGPLCATKCVARPIAEQDSPNNRRGPQPAQSTEQILNTVSNKSLYDTPHKSTRKQKTIFTVTVQKNSLLSTNQQPQQVVQQQNQAQQHQTTMLPSKQSTQITQQLTQQSTQQQLQSSQQSPQKLVQHSPPQMVQQSATQQPTQNLIKQSAQPVVQQSYTQSVNQAAQQSPQLTQQLPQQMYQPSPQCMVQQPTPQQQSQQQFVQQSPQQLPQQPVKQFIQQVPQQQSSQETPQQVPQQSSQYMMQQSSQQQTPQHIVQQSSQVPQQSLQHAVQQSPQHLIQSPQVQHQLPDSVQQSPQQYVQQSQQYVQQCPQNSVQQSPQQFPIEPVQQSPQYSVPQSPQRFVQQYPQQPVQQSPQHLFQQSTQQSTQQLVQQPTPQLSQQSSQISQRTSQMNIVEQQPRGAESLTTQQPCVSVITQQQSKVYTAQSAPVYVTQQQPYSQAYVLPAQYTCQEQPSAYGFQQQTAQSVRYASNVAYTIPAQTQSSNYSPVHVPNFQNQDQNTYILQNSSVQTQPSMLINTAQPIQNGTLFVTHNGPTFGGIPAQASNLQHYNSYELPYGGVLYQTSAPSSPTVAVMQQVHGAPVFTSSPPESAYSYNITSTPTNYILMPTVTSQGVISPNTGTVSTNGSPLGVIYNLNNSPKPSVTQVPTSAVVNNSFPVVARTQQVMTAISQPVINIPTMASPPQVLAVGATQPSTIATFANSPQTMAPVTQPVNIVAGANSSQLMANVSYVKNQQAMAFAPQPTVANSPQVMASVPHQNVADRQQATISAPQRANVPAVTNNPQVVASSPQHVRNNVPTIANANAHQATAAVPKTTAPAPNSSASSPPSATAVPRPAQETKTEVTNQSTTPPKSDTSSEGAHAATGLAIDNKIEQAMDLVKSHLMYTVRGEVEVLKERIAELMDRINQLEVENSFLKSHASPEVLDLLSKGAAKAHADAAANNESGSALTTPSSNI